MPGVGRDQGHGDSGRRAVVVRSWRMRVLLWPEQSALRADSENISPVLRDRLVAHLRRTCPV